MRTAVSVSLVFTVQPERARVDPFLLHVYRHVIIIAVGHPLLLLRFVYGHLYGHLLVAVARELQ
jgi:hypothetical protein